MQHLLESNGKKIILIGTAHVSRESTELVRHSISQIQPDTVCVELCESRYSAIQKQNQWQDTDIFKVIKEKKAFLLLANLLLSAFQKRIARRLEVRPGQEMLTAMESAEAIGATVHLVDRDIRVTLSRAWRLMGLWSKLKLMTQLLTSLGSIDEISAEDVERMKQEDMLQTVLSEVGKSLPEIRDILIDERDRYMAEKIRTAPGETIVAVVGAGHVPGIKKYWESVVDLPALEAVPPKSRWGTVAKWTLPALILLVFIMGFAGGGAEAGGAMITKWVAANGIMAGFGALLAFAHPLTVISAILAAPLTSLNPMVAAGWVSGLVEAFSRKPKVRDFETLSEDILSFKGFWRNKVTRVLLVVVFTNIGSSLGTMVAIPLMVRVMAG